MNSLQQLGERIQNLPRKADKYYQVYFTVVGGPIIAGGFIQFIFLLLYHLSPWLSIIAVLIAFILVFGAYKLIYGILRSYKEIGETNVRREVDYLILGMFMAEGLLAVIALSTLSFLLLHFHLVRYEGVDNSVLEKLGEFEKFTSFYIWHFVDNIPGVNNNAFNWQPKFTPANGFSCNNTRNL